MDNSGEANLGLCGRESAGVHVRMQIRASLYLMSFLLKKEGWAMTQPRTPPGGWPQWMRGSHKVRYTSSIGICILRCV